MVTHLPTTLTTLDDDCRQKALDAIDELRALVADDRICAVAIFSVDVAQVGRYHSRGNRADQTLCQMLGLIELFKHRVLASQLLIDEGDEN